MIPLKMVYRKLFLIYARNAGLVVGLVLVVLAVVVILAFRNPSPRSIYGRLAALERRVENLEARVENDDPATASTNRWMGPWYYKYCTNRVDESLSPGPYVLFFYASTTERMSVCHD